MLLSCRLNVGRLQYHPEGRCNRGGYTVCACAVPDTTHVIVFTSDRLRSASALVLLALIIKPTPVDLNPVELAKAACPLMAGRDYEVGVGYSPEGQTSIQLGDRSSLPPPPMWIQGGVFIHNHPDDYRPWPSQADVRLANVYRVVVVTANRDCTQFHLVEPNGSVPVIERPHAFARYDWLVKYSHGFYVVEKETDRQRAAQRRPPRRK